MTKTMLSKVMKKAWEIKKENKDNIFGLCLKMAWSIIKKGENRMEEYLKSLGLRVWEKKDSEGNTTQKRIYINDLRVIGIEEVFSNYKRCKFTIYYDCLKDAFYTNAYGRSDEKVFNLLCEKLRREAR